MPKLDLAPGGAPPASGERFEVGFADADGDRRGGNAMLHHRTLNPIIHRDWSERMELFVGALTRTAETDPHGTLTSSDDPPTNTDRPAPHLAPAPASRTAAPRRPPSARFGQGGLGGCGGDA